MLLLTNISTGDPIIVTGTVFGVHSMSYNIVGGFSDLDIINRRYSVTDSISDLDA